MHTVLWPILRKAISCPTQIAVIDDQRKWRYMDLVGGAFHLAKLIKKVSDKPNVGILLPTSGAVPMALLATWFLKRAAVPINFLLSETERDFIIKDSDVDIVITANPMLEHLGAEPKGVKLIKLDELSFDGMPPLRIPPVAKANSTAAILYTSGTSGRPKGVMLTHRNLSSNVKGAVKHVGLKSSDGFIGVLPQFHSFGLMALTLLPLTIGAKVVYTSRFIPAKLIKLISKHKPEIIIAIPSMFNALLSVKKATPDDFASIRIAVSGGEPLPHKTAEEFQSKYQVRILEGYGLTETSPLISWATPDKFKTNSVGQVLQDIDVRIIDDDGRDLPVGQEGELIVKGPNVMAGYYKMPEETKKAIDAEGYFHTGDWCKLDQEGYLYITGRKKEMLIIGGENVFPREIEEVLNAHPSVNASAVIGKQDPSRGEVAVAYIELHEGVELDSQALRSWCREHLAGFKVPREMIQVDQLPRNATGKIMRRELK